jgi:hypothetical protein
VGGHAEQLEQTSKDFPCLLLEMDGEHERHLVERIEDESIRL